MADNYEFCVPIPIRGQQYRISGCIDDITTLNPLTGGLTDLTAYIRKDDETSFNSTDNAPVEVGTSGFYDLDLSADECDCTSALIEVRATNTGAVYDKFVVHFYNLEEFDGRADEEDVVRVEHYLLQLWSSRMNKRICTETSESFAKADGTAWVSGEVSQTASQIEIAKQE